MSGSLTSWGLAVLMVMQVGLAAVHAGEHHHATCMLSAGCTGHSHADDATVSGGHHHVTRTPLSPPTCNLCPQVRLLAPKPPRPGVRVDFALATDAPDFSGACALAMPIAVSPCIGDAAIRSQTNLPLLN